jgi:hypothetical protein
MNMVLIPLAHTLETQTFSWDELVYITMRRLLHLLQQVADMFHSLFGTMDAVHVDPCGQLFCPDNFV